MLSTWKKERVDGLAGFYAGPSAKQTALPDTTRTDQLYAKIGQLQVEMEWLKKKSSGR